MTTERSETIPSATPTHVMWTLIVLAHRGEIRISRSEMSNANPKALLESFWNDKDEYVVRIKK